MLKTRSSNHAAQSALLKTRCSNHTALPAPFVHADAPFVHTCVWGALCGKTGPTRSFPVLPCVYDPHAYMTRLRTSLVAPSPSSPLLTPASLVQQIRESPRHGSGVAQSVRVRVSLSARDIMSFRVTHAHTHTQGGGVYVTCRQSPTVGKVVDLKNVIFFSNLNLFPICSPFTCYPVPTTSSEYMYLVSFLQLSLPDWQGYNPASNINALPCSLDRGVP